MAYEVPQETLQRTKGCPFAFACQRPGQWMTCSMEAKVNRRVLFITAREKDLYPCLSHFGLGYTCGCLTRAKSHFRYKV